MKDNRWVKMFQTENHQVLVMAQPQGDGKMVVSSTVMINGVLKSEPHYMGADMVKAQEVFDMQNRESAKAFLTRTIETGFEKVEVPQTDAKEVVAEMESPMGNAEMSEEEEVPNANPETEA